MYIKTSFIRFLVICVGEVQGAAVQMSDLGARRGGGWSGVGREGRCGRASR